MLTLFTFSIFSVSLWSFPSWSTRLSEEYSLVRDHCNFRESKGGKGIPAQGRILEESTKTYVINKSLIPLKPTSTLAQSQTPWRYVIALNCKRNSRNVDEIIEQLSQNLLPPEERERLAIVLGVNEKITLAEDRDYAPTWNTVIPSIEDLKKYNIPILFQYNQWTSFRSSKNNPSLTASQVRRELLDKLENIKKTKTERAYESELNKLIEEDNSHGFPYGTMRSFLLNHKDSQKFIKDLHTPGISVYIQIQDSDFTDLNTSPLFYNFISEEVVPVISPKERYLLKRYDALISHRKSQTGFLPIIVGGAHVYSPEEDLGDSKLNEPSQKLYTRFSSEMGNMVKHIVGQVQSYGLYFHEPNTLILAPSSVQQMLQKRVEDSSRLSSTIQKGIIFGIDSELQDFTRTLFDGCSDQTCRDFMTFSSNIVLATSMKRGKEKYFATRFRGTFDDKAKKFAQWSQADIKAIHSMAQEIIHPNKWTSAVSTSLVRHRKSDARKALSALFNLFDPHSLSKGEGRETYSPAQFYTTLIQYDDLIKNRSEDIKTKFSQFRSSYNYLEQGDLIGYYCISLAWECGQVMRTMFLNTFLSPQGLAESNLPNLSDITKFLTQRFNYDYDRGHPTPNPFVVQLLDLDHIPYRMAPKQMVAEIVLVIYEENKKNKAKTARILGTTAPTIGKLMKQQSPQQSKKIAKTFLEIGENDLKKKWGLTESASETLRSRLF